MRVVIGTPIYVNNQRNQTISFLVVGIARYSTSVQNQETSFCFLLFHKIGDPPRKMQKPVIDSRSVGSPTQSTSNYAQSSKEEVKGNTIL